MNFFLFVFASGWVLVLIMIPLPLFFTDSSVNCANHGYIHRICSSLCVCTCACVCVYVYILCSEASTHKLLQFALHYSWSTEARARRALANVSALLRPGGIFIGTMPDANVIIKKLREGFFKCLLDIFFAYLDKCFKGSDKWILRKRYGILPSFFVALFVLILCHSKQ